ncbi:MAG: hypothetical protein AAGI70_06920, partial [Pseudomonadota bacterium]
PSLFFNTTVCALLPAGLSPMTNAASDAAAIRDKTPERMMLPHSIKTRLGDGDSMEPAMPQCAACTKSENRQLPSPPVSPKKPQFALHCNPGEPSLIKENPLIVEDIGNYLREALGFGSFLRAVAASLCLGLLGGFDRIPKGVHLGEGGLGGLAPLGFEP